MVDDIRLLHVDDDPALLGLARELLERKSDAIRVQTETDPEAGLARIADGDVDCVLSDYDMPGRDGLALLDDVRESHPELPFILFTGQGSETVAGEALSRGATGYFRKESNPEHFAVVANAVENAVERYRDRTSYGELFAKVADGLVVHDAATGEIRDVNEQFCELTGHDRETLVGAPSDILRATDAADDPSALIQRAREEGVIRFEWHLPTADGSTIPCEVNLRAAELHGEQRVLASIRDITERDRRERALADRDRKITALHEAATDVVASESPTEVYERVVDAAETILDYDIAIADRREGDVLVPAALSSGIPDEGYYETTHLDADDNVAAMAYRTDESSLIDDLNEWEVAPARPTYRSLVTVPIGEFGVFQAGAEKVGYFDEEDLELTELLVAHARETLDRLAHESELEARTRELERQNDRLDEFARIVSHDLRNPLNLATGRLELARETVDNEHLARVADAHERMENLVTDVLTWARQGKRPDEQAAVDLDALCRACWPPAGAEDATLDVETTATVFAERDRLRRVFENLFRNCVEHGGSGVRVTVGDLAQSPASAAVDASDSTGTAPESEEPRVTDGSGGVSTHEAQEPYGGFYVADDGPGIPESERESVFDPGFTTSTEGTGFGLNIVREIAEAHGWTVALTESEQGGARFEFTGVETVE